MTTVPSGEPDRAPTGDTRRVPTWHPVLFAAWPVVALWAANVFEVPTADAVRVLALVVAGAAVAWLVAWAVVRLAGRGHAVARGALAAAPVVLAVGWAGQVLPDASAAVGLGVVGLVAVGGLAGATLLPAGALRPVTVVANVFSLVVVAMAGVPLVTHALGERTAPSAPVAIGGTDTPARDIWYVIPDRYPRGDVLAATFGHDNGPFEDWLTARGFTIQDRARANYPKTAHSLVATLNLDYVQELVPEPPADPADWGPLYELLDDHRLGRILTDAGYDYVHVGNWWTPTRTAATATETFAFDGATSEFASVWRSTTALRWVGGEAEEGLDQRRSKYELSRAQFDELDRLAREPHERPRLVVAHVTVPHEPYVFEPDGSYVDEATERSRTRSENMVNQVEWVNRRVRGLVDTLVTGDEATDPIVVVQSDEGPHPPLLDEESADWADIPTDQRAEKLRTLSAWYVPGVDEEPPEDITGVNTWRWILDRSLGTDFGLLEDRVFIYPTHADRYTFADVTGDFE